MGGLVLLAKTDQLNGLTSSMVEYVIYIDKLYIPYATKL
jgi:hypothetical protein